LKKSCPIAAMLMAAAVACFSRADALHAQDQSSAPSATTPDAQIAALIADLGSPHWPAREIATVKLQRLGPPIYGVIREAYRRCNRFEVRNRIKRIAYEIHLNEKIGPVRAFLGISHYPADKTAHSDGRVLPGQTAVQFTAIVPGSAAAMAGLEPDDLLLGLNGQLSTEAEPATEFISWIGMQLPGTTCTLRVFDGGEGRVLNKSIMNGFDVRGFRHAEIKVVSTDSRLPEGAAGIELVDVARADARLGLAAGDLIVALDGKLLKADSPEAVFQDWVAAKEFVKKNETDKRQPAPRIPRFRRPGAAREGNAAGTPSVQILRGGTVRDIEITLLARPANLQGGRVWQRNTSARAVRDAEAAFDVMWQEQFHTEGLASDRHDAEAVWRLETTNPPPEPRP